MSVQTSFETNHLFNEAYKELLCKWPLNPQRVLAANRLLQNIGWWQQQSRCGALLDEIN